MEAEAEPEAEPAAALLLPLPSAATLCGATAGMWGSCARRALRSELCSAEGMPAIAEGVAWCASVLERRRGCKAEKGCAWRDGDGGAVLDERAQVLRATRRAELGEQRRWATAD